MKSERPEFSTGYIGCVGLCAGGDIGVIIQSQDRDVATKMALVTGIGVGSNFKIEGVNNYGLLVMAGYETEVAVGFHNGINTSYSMFGLVNVGIFSIKVEYR